MLNVTSLYFLNMSLADFEISKTYYIEYLNTHNKKTWDLFNINSLGWFSLCQIADKKLMDESYTPLFERIIDYAKKIDEYSDYDVPTTDENINKTLTIIENLKKEFFKLMKIELHRYNYDFKNTTDKEIIRLIFGSIENSKKESKEDLKENINSFKKNLKNLNQIDMLSKENSL